jgi:hypothetical protein
MPKEQSFFINYHKDERHWWKEVLGFKIKSIAGVELFAHKNYWGEWRISDVLTGLSVSVICQDFEKKRDAIRSARTRLERAIDKGNLQKAFDEQISKLRECGLLDDQNNKIGEKVMIESEISDA